MDKIDFWVQLGVSSFWAAIIVVGITAFLAGMALMRLIDGVEIRTERARREDAKDRLNQIVEDGTLTAKRLADMQATQADLQIRYAKLEREGVANKEELNAIRTMLSRLETDTGAVATANSTTQKIARGLLEYDEPGDIASFRGVTSRSD
jgi:hypothetical protein